MKNLFLFLVIVVCGLQKIKSENINKPISSQYGFIENKGQIIDQNNNPNPTVLYLYNGNGMRVQLRKVGFSYEVIQTVKTPKAIIEKEFHGKFATQADSFDITYKVHRVDINFKEGNKNTTLKAYQPAADFINYYTTGTSEEGVRNVQHFGKVIYENVYPNIDIEFVLDDAANKGKFKYNFIVKPNANLADIQLELLGANSTNLTKDGNILIETAYGNLEETIPLSYVINENKSHTTIQADFTQLTNNIYGIKAEKYNPNQILVIDPTNWATYYGGNGSDYSSSITADKNGKIMVTGYTFSTTTIATSGSHQVVFNGGTYDAFIAVFNSIGIRLWATYYGGSNSDSGVGIVTDSIGNIILVGNTRSTTSIATVGSHQPSIGGVSNVFIVKFNSNGVRQWGTYFGGNQDMGGKGVAIDTSGNIVVIGTIKRPVNISYDVFILKFNSNGSVLWVSYFGGTGDDDGKGIAINRNSDIIIIGNTLSNNSIATTGSHQTVKGGDKDAFIAKFNSSGVRIWATYYGGTDYEEGGGVTTDTSDNIIVTGYSRSTSGIASIGSH